MLMDANCTVGRNENKKFLIRRSHRTTKVAFGSKNKVRKISLNNIKIFPRPNTNEVSNDPYFLFIIIIVVFI